MADAEAERWKDFGAWLRAERMAMGLRITEIAPRAALSPSTWGNLEKGGRTYRGEWVLPSPEDVSIVRIARVLERDPAELFERLGRPWDKRRQRNLEAHISVVTDSQVHGRSTPASGLGLRVPDDITDEELQWVQDQIDSLRARRGR